jgi:tetratricopeptide (TPR) repeat protein
VPSSEEVSQKELSQTLSLLRSLEQNMNYFARAIEDERRTLEEKDSVTPSDILKARGYSLAHAGEDEKSISDLKALVSQQDYATPHNLNKLAQVLVRVNQHAGLEEAISISETVLTKEDIPEDEVWFANHNLAAALISLGRLTEALKAANTALSIRHDERTAILKTIAENGLSSLDFLADQGVSVAHLASFSSPAPINMVTVSPINLGILKRME